MNRMRLTDLRGMDWDQTANCWYSVANGIVTPERLLEHAIQMEGEIIEARDLMLKFVNKVQAGKARCRVTYAEMKAWLAHLDE